MKVNQLNITLPAEIAKALSLACAETGLTKREVVTRAIVMHLERGHLLFFGKPSTGELTSFLEWFERNQLEAQSPEPRGTP